MGLLIKKATDHITVSSIKVLLYGQPGVRKTSYSFSAPSALLVDCDNGIRRVAPEFRGDYVTPSNWQDMLAILDDPSIRDYKTLVFDTVSKMMDMCGAYVMQKDIKNKAKDGSLSLKGFGALGTEFKSFVGRASLLGINLVFVAHDKEAKVGDETIIRPDVTGSSLGVLIKDMDLVGYVQMFNNQSVVCFSPTDRFYGKNTAGLPDQIRTGEMKLADIFTLYETKVNEGSEDLKILNSQMAQVETILSNVTTCEELNDAKENISAIEFVLTGKQQAIQMVKQKAEELTCELDKVSKKYYTVTTPADGTQVSGVPEPA